MTVRGHPQPFCSKLRTRRSQTQTRNLKLKLSFTFDVASNLARKEVGANASDQQNSSRAIQMSQEQPRKPYNYYISNDYPSAVVISIYKFNKEIFLEKLNMSLLRSPAIICFIPAEISL